MVFWFLKLIVLIDVMLFDFYVWVGSVCICKWD